VSVTIVAVIMNLDPYAPGRCSNPIPNGPGLDRLVFVDPGLTMFAMGLGAFRHGRIVRRRRLD
jgi:hypothetical protein